MSARTVLVIMVGAGLGLGMLLLALAWADGRTGPRWRPNAADGRRMAAAVAVAIAVLALTRWVAVAAALAALVFCWPAIFGAAAANRAAVARLDALAGWAESLRDLTAAGVGLPDALGATVLTAGEPIRPSLAALAERLRERTPLPAALAALADELADPDADLIIAALQLNAAAQGRQLVAVLSALASSARAQAEARRTVDAERRGTRRGVLIVLAVTITVALGLALLNPGYVAPYRSPTGQLMLAVVVAVFAVGFAWLRRLALPSAEPRILGPRPGRTEGGGRC